ncbi:hypothetical protein [Arthrobacter sp. ISL-65]|uniref:hypothetical protein n=1 Tax=Arthrobacter sp. ISL-65 TaxID=2819112 RepID=UPI001BECE781|nr:hypothetical protein [Arthrobacter sp. ISL-65]MBT2549666.1 hypothetical protein [Arthrobacter sp. ISL-65]
MYNNLAAPAAAGIGGSALAFTGAGDALWLGLAAFAMVALGTAIKRIVPARREAGPKG